MLQPISGSNDNCFHLEQEQQQKKKNQTDFNDHYFYFLSVCLFAGISGYTKSLKTFCRLLHAIIQIAGVTQPVTCVSIYLFSFHLFSCFILPGFRIGLKFILCEDA